MAKYISLEKKNDFIFGNLKLSSEMVGSKTVEDEDAYANWIRHKTHRIMQNWIKWNVISFVPRTLSANTHARVVTMYHRYFMIAAKIQFISIFHFPWIETRTILMPEEFAFYLHKNFQRIPIISSFRRMRNNLWWKILHRLSWKTVSPTFARALQFHGR